MIPLFVYLFLDYICLCKCFAKHMFRCAFTRIQSACDSWQNCDQSMKEHKPSLECYSHGLSFSLCVLLFVEQRQCAHRYSGIPFLNCNFMPQMLSEQTTNAWGFIFHIIFYINWGNAGVISNMNEHHAVHRNNEKLTEYLIKCRFFTH